MQKAKKWNIADTNMALFGTELERNVKKAAAKCEASWHVAGKAPGLQDSYIVLHTYKKDPKSEALSWDIHFWLGHETTQDEAGTAAYKTVELDDFLNGAAVQHREVQSHESKLFMSYFADKGGLRILAGGVESGFRHVEATSYRTRLLWLKGKKHIRCTEVDLKTGQLNDGDVFIVDAGLQVMQWNGASSGAAERMKGAQLCRALADERGGAPTIHVYAQGDSDLAPFWAALGGERAVAPADSVPSDEEWEATHDPKVFQLSDASGKLKFKLIARGPQVNRSLFSSQDAFIYDMGQEVFVWIGRSASTGERKHGLQYAQQYLAHAERPLWLPVSSILEGAENEVFESSFEHFGGTPAPGPKAASPSVDLGKAEHTREAGSDVEALYQAAKGIGCDKDAIIDVISNRNAADIANIKQQFEAKYGETLEKRLCREWTVRFAFRTLLLALLKQPHDYLAEQLRRTLSMSVRGVGCNVSLLIDVITQAPQRQLDLIAKAYAQLVGTPDDAQSFLKAVRHNTHFQTQKVLCALLQPGHVRCPANATQAKADAEALYAAGEKRLGTNKAQFVEIVTRSSAEHLTLVSNAYAEVHGKSLVDAIGREVSGSFRRALQALCRPRAVHFAKRFRAATKGLGTANTILHVALVMTDRRELGEVKKVYAERYNTDLLKELSEDTSGAYKKS